MRLSLVTACLPLLMGAALMLPQDEKQRPVPTVGKPAPVIRLNDHEGKATTVGGAAQHWSVLAFYPKAATPG